jgi:hypothetical protein
LLVVLDFDEVLLVMLDVVVEAEVVPFPKNSEPLAERCRKRTMEHSKQPEAMGST